MYYYNMAGQRFQMRERPLEPPDCCGYDPQEEDEEDERGTEDDQKSK